MSGQGSRRSTTKNLDDLFPEEWHYSVVFSIVSRCTLPRLDPSDYTETINGVVSKVAEDGSEEDVGQFVGYRLRRDLAADEGVSFFEIADAFAADTCDYVLEVFDEDGEVHPEVEQVLGEEPRWGPVLMAHTLRIDPAHRGRGLGYAVINSFIETFEPGAGLVIGRAAPMNPEDLEPAAMNTPGYREWRAQGVKKLREYWKGLGFVPASRSSEFILMNLALKRRPLVEAILAMRARRQRRLAKPKSGSGDT
jgi:GNAT superfamily N-acetyltransferase